MGRILLRVGGSCVLAGMVLILMRRVINCVVRLAPLTLPFRHVVQDNTGVNRVSTGGTLYARTEFCNTRLYSTE